MYDTIIIGSGPSGLSAAIYTGRSSFKTLVLEKAFPGGQLSLTYEIENYPGFENISGVDLSLKFDAHAKSFGAEFKNEEVLSVNLTDKIKTVKTSSGEYSAKTVIFSTGAKPRKIGIESEDRFVSRGISYCATCDGNFYKGKDVAVIGGGNTAIEDAIYLSRICNKVYLIHRRQGFRAEKKLVDYMQSIENIEPVLDCVTTEILGDQTVNGISVLNTVSNETKSIPVNGIFVAIGILPNNELIKDSLALDDNGYIITNEKMETSTSGVYAVGDVRNTPLRQVVTACADGAIAAYSISNYLSQ